jgi:hypothetical protein
MVVVVMVVIVVVVIVVAAVMPAVRMPRLGRRRGAPTDPDGGNRRQR